MATPREIEKLKAGWVKDPIFDVAAAEGFEEHRGELMAFKEKWEATWKEQRAEHRAKLTAKICPVMSVDFGAFRKCQLEKCAWWNEDAERCGKICKVVVKVSNG